MTPREKNIRNITLAVILAIGIFIAGIFVGPKVLGMRWHPAFASSGNEDVDLSTFWRVWQTLEAKYPFENDAPEDKDKVYGATAGLAASYGDPYTMFFEPSEAKIFAEDVQGEFGGVGMEVGMRNGLIVVIAPLKDTPAYQAGIQSGDILLEIDGESTAGMSVDEAVQIIRGEKGSQVLLTIAREGETEPLEIAITRGNIIVPTLETQIVSDDIFVIELYSFSANVFEEFAKAMAAFDESGSSKLILDMRGNPGGYLSGAIDIASLFLPKGKVVLIEDFGSKEKQEEYRSQGYLSTLPKDFEMAVLVDGGSASASEILAGALQDHDRAIVVGEQTFGKGSVQELIDLPGGSSLKVTIARWLTPKGNSINEEGLTPDIVVEYTLEDREAERDPQLERAIAELED